MKSELCKSLQASGIRFVRFAWCDNANVIRAKAAHIGVLEEHLEQGIGITASLQAFPVMFDTVVPESGLTPTGEVWLVPDWPTLNILPYAPSHARVMGDIVQNGEPWPLCPRYFLKRVIAEAKKEGLEVMAGFENEFYLLQSSSEGIVPADDTVYASTLGMDLSWQIIDAISDALLAQNIVVERYHPESAPGQHEISIRYTAVGFES